MHDQVSPAQEDDQIDRAILCLLLKGAAFGPWSDEEIARELGDEIAAEDGLARLAGAGLVHRIKPGFVWPSRAALHGARL